MAVLLYAAPALRSRSSLPWRAAPPSA